MDHFIIKNILH